MINRIFYAVVAVVTALSISLSVSLFIKKLPETKVRNDYQGLSAADLKKKIQTPLEAQKFTEALYGPKSFCLAAARLIAYLIADDGFNPQIVVLIIDNVPCHYVCVFKENGRFGAADNGIFGYFKPEHSKIDDLVNHIGKKENVRMTYKLTEKGLLFDKDYFSVNGLQEVLKILDEK
ncbi:MAG: hypothetical protein PHN74_02980 [Candidatus Pacebacteria bacterium]|nr:hypothetical protein [Candidatus Paceibacterota bacterium]